MTRKSNRHFWIAGAATLALAFGLLLERQARSQMISSGATDQPARPLPPGMKAPVVDFRDVAAQAGLSAVVVSGDLEQTYVVENTGTGVAIFDYDNDGLPDIFLVQGDRLKPGLTPLTPHLYHNLGGLRFEDVTEKAGIGHTGWGQGVCAGDADNDGNVDLFLGSGATTYSSTTWETVPSATKRASAVWTVPDRVGAPVAHLSTMTAMGGSIL